MVEPRVGPVIHAVALRAVGGEASSHMIRVAGALKVRTVASDAGGAHSHEYAAGCALVATLAGSCGVTAEERETVVMIERGSLRDG